MHESLFAFYLQHYVGLADFGGARISARQPPIIFTMTSTVTVVLYTQLFTSSFLRPVRYSMLNFSKPPKKILHAPRAIHTEGMCWTATCGYSRLKQHAPAQVGNKSLSEE